MRDPTQPYSAAVVNARRNDPTRKTLAWAQQRVALEHDKKAAGHEELLLCGGVCNHYECYMQITIE